MFCIIFDIVIINGDNSDGVLLYDFCVCNSADFYPT